MSGEIVTTLTRRTDSGQLYYAYEVITRWDYRNGKYETVTTCKNYDVKEPIANNNPILGTFGLQLNQKVTLTGNDAVSEYHRLFVRSLMG